MYDNACNAEHYFLNCEPEFNKNIEFLRGRSSTSSAYAAGAYNTGMPLVQMYTA
jgi:hypothetical protein